MAMMELPAQLVLCGLGSRQQLPGTSIITQGQQCRSTVSLLVGRAGVQNVCVVTLFKSRWPVYPSLSTRLSTHGGKSDGRNRCLSSVWKRLPTNANASVDSDEAQAIEHLWAEYFADPSQWWDNRVNKNNPRSPDFKHKVTWKALWVDGSSNPPWVKTMLKSVTQGKLQPHVSYRTRGSHGIAQPNRSGFEHVTKLCPPAAHKKEIQHMALLEMKFINERWKQNTLLLNNNWRRNSRPTSMREWRQFAQVDDAGMHLQNASTTSVAVAILKNNVRQGITIGSYMYVEVLQRCLDLVSAKQVYDCIRNSRMEQNMYVANNLLRVFVRCGRLPDARQVFDRLVKKKNVFSRNIMIGGYGQHDHVKDAIQIFNHMRQEGAQPNEITYLSILKACTSPVALKWGKEIHAHIRHGGFASDVRVGTALVNMYAESGSIDDARLGFDRMVERNVVIWNVMIGGLAQHGFGHEAFSLFLQMQRGGFLPNAITYVSILSACASAGVLEWVKEVQSHALRAGLESRLRVGTALVNMYAEGGSIDGARLVFDRMVDRDVVTWTVMIGGLAQHGFGHEAFSLFLQMQREGFVPNAITYVSILSACASAGGLEWMKEVHSHALSAGLESDLRVGTALIHMYARSGSVGDARLVFDRMVERNVFYMEHDDWWTCTIRVWPRSSATLGRMNEEGVRPNGKTLLATLSACSHGGLVDEGRHQFLAMTQDYGIEPAMEHYTCMVDLLGRAGHLEEAKLLILNMPLEPNGATWGALLGACRSYGNVELAEFAAKECLKLKPHHTWSSPTSMLQLASGRRSEGDLC